MKEIAIVRLYPACFVSGKDAARYDAMQVKMIQEPLVPGVQYGSEPYRAAEVVPAELKQGLRDSLKQN
jgi:hypothetical protein